MGRALAPYAVRKGVGPPLPRSFYDRDAAAVAEELVGALLVWRRAGQLCVGRIVEVEAYLGPHDRACHSARGRTPRTEVMFGPPGHAYVYLVYGMHHCFNIVTGPPGHAAAVLLRALEPVRGWTGDARGPGRLCRAMGVDRTWNGRDLCAADLFVAVEPDAPRPALVRRPRIGVDYAGAWARRRLRFHIRHHPCVPRF